MIYPAIHRFMKKILKLLLVAYVTFISFVAEAQSFIWADAVFAYPNNALLDKNSNSYIGGVFTDSARFGDTTVYGYSKPFIVKYDQLGHFSKMVTASDPTSGVNNVMMVSDHNGSFYLMGEFGDTLTFGSFQAIAPVAADAYFVVKFDSALNVQWLKTFIDSVTSPVPELNGLYPKNIACDDNGDIYLTGICYTPFVVDTVTVDNTVDPVFLLKLNGANGTACWVSGITSNNYANLFQMAADAGGNVVISGLLSHRYLGDTIYAVFGGTDTLWCPAGNEPAFLAKYDAMGNYQWSKIIDTIGVIPGAMAVDPGMNIYLSVDSPGNYVSLKKYNGAGDLVWINPMRINNWPAFLNCRSGSCYMALNFTDTFSYITSVVTQPGTQGMIIKFDTAAGNLIWNAQPLTTGQYVNETIDVRNGNLLVMGNVVQPTHFSATMIPGPCRSLAMMNDTTFTPPGNNTIKGNIYNDTDNNCLLTSDPALAGFAVVALPGPYFAVADSQGNYTLKVDTGTYTVSELLPFDHDFTDTQICATTSYTLPMLTAGLTDTGCNFPNTLSQCGLLRLIVNDTIPYFNCFGYHYFAVSLQNIGNDTVAGVQFYVQYPNTATPLSVNPTLSPLSASLAWTSYSSADSLLTYNIGTMFPGETIPINITDTVMCVSGGDTSYPFGVVPYHYSFRLTPINACYPDDSAFNIASLTEYFDDGITVSVASASKEDLHIFPNPTTGKIKVTGAEQDGDFEIVDMIGTRWYGGQIEHRKDLEIDISSAPTGVYLLTIHRPGKVISQRIVKM